MSTGDLHMDNHHLKALLGTIRNREEKKITINTEQYSVMHSINLYYF